MAIPIKKFIPGSLKTMGKKLVPHALIDKIDIWLGERDVLTPPKRLEFVGAGDFKEHGRLFAQRFRAIAGLTPTTRLLDIGSGVGRIAVGLLEHITAPTGHYDGLEIVKAGVDWCQQVITPRYPHFRFHHVNVYNKFYNPTARLTSSEFVFPFPDDSFDLIVLTSVFTHMLEKDVTHYLSEMARVLAPGGRIYLTMFLLNEESRQLLQTGRSTIPMHPFTPVSMIQRPDMPEQAIAFDETWARAQFIQAGLTLKDEIRYGAWVGRTDYYDYQDTVVLSA